MSSNVGVTEQALKQATRWYWSISGTDSTLEATLDRYIKESRRELGDKSLLEAELAWAEKHGQIESRPCEVLVLLVGLSLEPLMQSVYVHKPKKIVLILNEEGYPGEGWREFAGHVINSIKLLAKRGLIEQPPQFLGPDNVGYPTFDNPKAIFGQLVRVLHDEEDVVIDVTGGKKSMVTGAFMYAAYAGIRISYVDFKIYDKDHRRPYGYTCKISGLANPYEEFALREWERVREAYEKYQFGDAAKLLDSIANVMEGAIPEAKEPIAKLRAFFKYYGKWHRGDFRGAKQAAESLEAFEQPTAVIELGNKWYQIKDGDFADKPKGFYGDERGLQVYVCDEIERIRRLIEYSEDYRSAFVRAAGLNEIVMLARLVRLITDPGDRREFLAALDASRTPSATKVFLALTDPNKNEIDVRQDILVRREAPSLVIPRPSQMTVWWQKTKLFIASEGWKRFLDIRNELMHKYFSVPRQWAEDALTFVVADFEDFLGHPLSDLKVYTKALPWPCLCELCGISNYLPPSLRQEVLR